jgi:ankyrin repeat protein
VGSSDAELIEAVTADDAARVAELVAADPSLASARNRDGVSALMLARYRSDRAVTEALIAAGAGVNVYSTNEMRVQPLHSAAASRSHEVCRLLIASGADVNGTQQHGFTPLHAAAQHGDAELVELFLSAGADPTARTDTGEMPADIAEAAGHVDVARRLSEVGSA